MNHKSIEHKNEEGFALLETLVGMALLAIMGLAIAMTTISSLALSKKVEANQIASSLAISKLEEFSAQDASEIDTSSNETEASVSWPGVNYTFRRVTTVVVNADNSRTVSVQVNPNHGKINTTASFTTTYALWE